MNFQGMKEKIDLLLKNPLAKSGLAAIFLKLKPLGIVSEYHVYILNNKDIKLAEKEIEAIRKVPEVIGEGSIQVNESEVKITGETLQRVIGAILGLASLQLEGSREFNLPTTEGLKLMRAIDYHAATFITDISIMYGATPKPIKYDAASKGVKLDFSEVSATEIRLFEGIMELITKEVNLSGLQK